MKPETSTTGLILVSLLLAAATPPCFGALGAGSAAKKTSGTAVLSARPGTRLS